MTVAFANGEGVIIPISVEMPEDEVAIPISEEFEEDEQEEVIKMQLEIEEINDIQMVHIRPVLEEFGFSVKYNSEDKSVEIIRGPYHSIVSVNKNSYYKLRMAHRKLSSAPIIKNSKMYVPVEFLTLMTDIAVDIEDDKFIAHNGDFAIYSGYVSEIRESDGRKTIVLSDETLEYDMETAKIIHLNENTLLNGSYQLGEFVEIVSPPIVLLSLPPQMGAVVIFQSE
jgi:hypothetical protein